jgi:hypothetical protein
MLDRIMTTPNSMAPMPISTTRPSAIAPLSVAAPIIGGPRRPYGPRKTRNPNPDGVRALSKSHDITECARRDSNP